MGPLGLQDQFVRYLPKLLLLGVNDGGMLSKSCLPSRLYVSRQAVVHPSLV